MSAPITSNFRHGLISVVREPCFLFPAELSKSLTLTFESRDAMTKGAEKIRSLMKNVILDSIPTGRFSNEYALDKFSIRPSINTYDEFNQMVQELSVTFKFAPESYIQKING